MSIVALVVAFLAGSTLGAIVMAVFAAGGRDCADCELLEACGLYERRDSH